MGARWGVTIGRRQEGFGKICPTRDETEPHLVAPSMTQPSPSLHCFPSMRRTVAHVAPYGMRASSAPRRGMIVEARLQETTAKVATSVECGKSLGKCGECCATMAALLNMGDSYTNDAKWGGTTGGKHAKGLHGEPVGRGKRQTGLPPKSLLGMPWRLAFALQANGWTLRSEIIWSKVNCMPESVQDCPTRSHEQVFLFSKREHYYYNAEAIREANTPDMQRRAEP